MKGRELAKIAPCKIERDEVGRASNSGNARSRGVRKIFPSRDARALRSAARIASREIWKSRNSVNKTYMLTKIIFISISSVRGPFVSYQG